MSGMYGYSREAVRVKVKKCEGNLPPEWRKFSVDPQITTLEVLYSILAKAFDLKTDFGISYKAIDPTTNQEVYLHVLSDYDLDAAFLRAHNQSNEPCLNLHVDIKPFSEAPDWESSGVSMLREVSPFQQSISSGQKYVQNVQNRLPGLIMNQMEKTISMVQRAFNLVEDPMISQPPRNPLSDVEFRGYLDSVGQIVHAKELKEAIYVGGIDPSLRRVVWKHILNVYPEGMTGKERIDYMKRKGSEYFRLRDKWKAAIQKGSVVGELAYVTSMVRKDVLRTDRLHPFYAGHDDNQNIASLFNILTTYALNHPAVSYCQGMSDIASPLLVTMGDEAHAYICFCAVMTRLKTNFMLDGIAMTTKFSHLSEALQFYDPEFYEYLKIQQADDLLFCYRWLLLEMKREFAFEDSLRMLEVLWSSLPSTPPEKELSLYEKEFEPPSINEIPLPKSPSVILRTPRENPYTKICALRRQNSALSLHSSTANNNNNVSSSLRYKLNSSKKMNHSLDENITRDRKSTNVGVKSHQSLDESKMHYNTTDLLELIKNDSNKNNNEENIKSDKLKLEQQRPRSVSPIKTTTDLEKTNDIDSMNNGNKSNNEECIQIQSVEDVSNEKINIDDRTHHARALNQISNKLKLNTQFCSTGNLISKQLMNKKGGHFKDLKEKIVASKKGIFASLDKIESFPLETQTPIEDGPKTQNYQTKGQKVVKNFNEFLNFATINKNRISDRLANNINSNNTKINKPTIKLTKSPNQEDNLESQIKQTNDKIETDKVKPSFNLNLSNIAERQTSFDGSSPDDSQEYFPMTTSMTREFRLELENLDRQVFGTDYHQRAQINILSGYDTPESGDSVDKVPYSEIIYKKLTQNSIDCVEIGNKNEIEEINTENIFDKNGGEIMRCPIVNGVKIRNTSSKYDETNSIKRISSSSINNDIFIWENPLHQYCGNSPQQPVKNFDDNKKETIQITTPDEQYDLDFDGEIIEENNLGKTSVTPIRLVHKNNENSNRNSMLNDNDSDNSDNSWNNKQQNLNISQSKNNLKTDLIQPSDDNLMTNSCEVASEAPITFPSVEMTKVSGILPPPKEFGCGNPFLMFLCLTILLQHRDYVIKSNMDYNEMAMHFDKMVRKHNVIRVLNQARRMYAEYLKSQNSTDNGDNESNNNSSNNNSNNNISNIFNNTTIVSEKRESSSDINT